MNLVFINHLTSNVAANLQRPGRFVKSGSEDCGVGSLPGFAPGTGHRLRGSVGGVYVTRRFEAMRVCTERRMADWNHAAANSSQE